MSLSVYLAFLLATILVMVAPGSTNTLIVANSVRYGRSAGLLNVAGTQAGLALTVGLVLLGLTSLIAAMGAWFVWVKLAGAAYLVWLGLKLMMGGAEQGAAPKPRGGFLVQGMAVELSNPKTLLFFGAFFPQFMDMNRNHMVQVLMMGATAMAVAALSDSAYALLASRTAKFLSKGRVRMMNRLSGTVLIGGGLWLALSRSK